MIEDEATKQNVLLGIDGDHMPDRAWLIIALGTLNKDHPIFAKDYKPKVTKPVSAAQRMMMLSNEDGLYTGLPHLSAKE